MLVLLSSLYRTKKRRLTTLWSKSLLIKSSNEFSPHLTTYITVLEKAGRGGVLVPGSTFTGDSAKLMHGGDTIHSSVKE